MTRETETAGHRESRIRTSEKSGMIRPERIARLASNCYSCHTVPQKKLVNVGGHPAGSKFELVSWSQGEVRHNVWFTPENNLSSDGRRRILYITGQAVDLAYALKGVSKATEKGEHATTMAKRAKAAILRLKRVAEVVDVPEIKKIIQIGEQADLKLKNERALSKAADQVN